MYSKVETNSNSDSGQLITDKLIIKTKIIVINAKYS